MKPDYKNIDEYVASFDGVVKDRLIKLRKIMCEEIPEAKEEIKYGIPTYVLNGNIIHFGGYKNFVSVYPSPKPIEKMQEKLRKFKTSKGAVQFQNSEDMPWELIRKLVRLTVSIHLGEIK